MYFLCKNVLICASSANSVEIFSKAESHTKFSFVGILVSETL